MEGSEEERERETGRVVNMASGGEFRFKDTQVLEEGLAHSYIPPAAVFLAYYAILKCSWIFDLLITAGVVAVVRT